MPQTDVMTLGPFAVSEEGALAPRAPGLAPALRFVWGGRVCQGLLRDGLRLSAEVGRVPSTASGRDRSVVFAALPGLRIGLPAGWALRLLPDHRLRVEAMAALPSPITAVTILAALTAFALDLDPWLNAAGLAGIDG